MTKTKTKTKAQKKETDPTPQLPQFYKKVVPLNKTAHSGLYLEPIENYLHTKDTNSVYIAAIEFIKASHEYPIVFASNTDGSIFPVVLLGLEQQKNAFINKAGQWLANYIPAYVRRYPFILAMNEDQFTVCIDEGFAGFNTAKEGQPLFNEKGEELKPLLQAIEFLKEYQQHVQLTTLFCDNMKKLELLEPVEANIEFASGQKKKMGGFMCVNRKKLKDLKPEDLSQLVKSDQLELIYAHLASLDNLQALMKRAAAN